MIILFPLLSRHCASPAATTLPDTALHVFLVSSLFPSAATILPSQSPVPQSLLLFLFQRLFSHPSEKSKSLPTQSRYCTPRLRRRKKRGKGRRKESQEPISHSNNIIATQTLFDTLLRKKGSRKRAGRDCLVGKDLRCVIYTEKVSGKEKTWVRMILKEPRRNLLKLSGSRYAEGEKGGSRQGGSLRRCVKSGRETLLYKLTGI